MERTEFKAHISEQYNRNLEDLFNQVLEMGGMVEKQLDNALEAIKCNDLPLARNIKVLDKIVNKEEMEINRLCASVLARQQPTASDLRLIIIAIRIAVDLERMGDESVNAAKLAIKMSDSDYQCESIPGYSGLLEIATCATEMLKKSLNAFSRLDLSEIADIIDDEERMDIALKTATQSVLNGFTSTTIPPEYLIEMIYALRAAERITDHAVNIAESVVYLVEGQDIRNMDTDKLLSFLNGVNKSS